MCIRIIITEWAKCFFNKITTLRIKKHLAIEMIVERYLEYKPPFLERGINKFKICK
mgnify:CR=1 FL=1